MRKIFLLIPALLLALVVNADEINISSGTSNIIHYTIADSNTKDGDVIVLTDAGPYISTAGVDDYTKLVKNLTIKAADGINPVIKLEVPFRSTGGKSVKFIGITFDGTSLSSSYDFYFRFYDNADNLEFEDCEFKNISKYIFDVYTDKSANSLVIKNCNFHDVSSRGILNRGTIGEINISGSTFSSFTDYPIIHNYSNGSIGKIKIDGSEFYSNAKYLINGEATSHADSCIITNCYFHNNSRSAVYFAASTVDGVETCDGVIVKNSTFANNDMSASDGSVIEVRNYNAAVASNIEVTVDHCTFYNNPTSASGYAAIRSYKSTKVNVSNCIFAHPTSYDRCGTYCYGGNVTNCLAYNLTSGTNGHHSGPTLTGNFTADPLFADAANGDFSLAGNWVTMNLSPARGAATDGSDLGDPRWYSAEVLPDVDFASPYQFIGTKAVLNGNIRLNASNHIEYYDKSECGTAKWKIHATRACVLQATLNMESGSSSGHIFRVEFLDADGNHVDEVAEPAESSHDGNIDLPNSLSIPAAGDYIVILHNDKSWSSAVIEGVTLTYVGGAVITVPAEELIGEEAVLVDAGHLKVSKLANGDLKYGDNGNQLDEYVYWNINATKAGDMKVTLNVVAPEVGDASTHNFLVELYSDLNAAPIASSAEASATSGTGARELPDLINIPATGNYIIKLTNQTQWSSAILHSIQFEYAGGAVITVPAEEMIGEDAVIVDEGHKKVYKLVNGNLQYDDNGTPLGEYVYWNINATKAGDMKVTLNVVAPEVGDASTHNFLVELYSDLNAAPIASSAEASATSGTGARELPDLINIPATGNYIIKLTNQTQWSSAILHSIQFEYVGGAVINIPAEEMIGEDAVIVDEGHKKVYKDADGNLQYNDNSTPLGEYVYWNINATEAGDMNVTLNVVAPEVGPASGHQFLVELYSDLNASPIASSAEASSTSATGARELPDVINIPATGSYIIKLTNQTQWSSAILHSITFTAAPVLSNVTIDDNATDNSAWVANVGGAAVNAELTRTFVGGMYNTISLPFAVSSEKVVAAFGAGVELMEMTDATLDGTVLDFVFTPTTSIYQGTPYLIKPTADVANPQFNGVEFVLDNAAGSASGGTNADFIGTFVKTTILADVNNLYLQSGNVLKFSENDVTIKGTRAYFHVDVPSGILPVVKPRIVMNGQVITDIELINGEPVVNGKFIENGQLIIIRDGVRYNALGVRVK